MIPPEPKKPASSITGLLSDQDLRRQLIRQGWIVPRIEGLPWAENFNRAVAIQRQRRAVESAR